MTKLVKGTMFSKSGALCLFLSLLFPIGAIILSFCLVNKKNIRVINIAIAISVFAIFTTIPPYQDLYRRYLDTYLSYSDFTTYADAISGHVDILMYVIALFLKKNDIPFYIFPAVQAGVVTYLFLSSTKDVIESEYYDGDNIKLPLFISFLFINLIAGALGLRFYIAVALFTKGVTIYLFNRRLALSFILMISAAFFHFSMLLPIFAFIGSRFVRIKTSFVPVFFVIGFIFGSLILTYIIDSGILGYLGQYIKAGYIDYSGNAEIDTKGNALIVTIWRYLMLLLIYIPCYYLKQRRDQRIDFINFVGVYLIISSLTSISANAFNRYMIAIGSFFVLLNFFLVIRFNIRRISVVALIFVFIINFVFQNIYLQRRPILLGTMWTGLYKPTVFSLLRTDQEFKLILNQIDDDGDWVKDKLATK
ncbi:TPA: EpsG family protein [Klebsiella pneumoniae]